MTVLLNKENLFSTFKVECFDELELSIGNCAPSMTEYYLDDLALYSDNSVYLNKTNIEKTIPLNNYFIYLDYSNNIFLEVTKDNSNEFETASLW